MSFWDTTLEFLGMSALMGEDTPEKPKEKTDEHKIIEQPLKYNFRPRNLNEYIGQEKTKMFVRSGIKSIQMGIYQHLLISGIKGAGKTTLAYIIANELKLPIQYITGNSLTNEFYYRFLETNI